jgi:hypothetical protein
MALINGNKFRKITQRYCCDSKVFETAREHIINNYCPSEHIQVGRCPITITDNSTRWLMPRKKNRYLDLALTSWRIPRNMPITWETYLQLTYEGAEELILDEFERRKEILPMDEVLREAKDIINPTYKCCNDG